MKTRKLKRSQRENHWLSLAWRGRLWLVQRPDQGIWAGLWSLCEFEDAQALQRATAAWPGQWRSLPSFTHVLTHLDWRLHPVQLCLPDALDEASVAGLTASLPGAAQGRWVPLAEVPAMGLPAALRKLLDQLVPPGTVDAIDA